MTISPAATVTPVVDDSAFTLVEEDDVAFTLALSREIHRLYGSYQDGELNPTESLWAGLDLTRRTVLMLQSTVSAGMPAMRLQVMAAQSREMLAVLFGELSSDPAVSGRPRGGIAATPPAGLEALSGGRPTPVTPPWRDPPAAPPVSGALNPAPAGAPPVVRRSRSSALWTELSAPARMALGLVLCALAAVAIDVPITVMALFPNDLTTLTGAYVLIAVAAWMWHHKRARAAGTVRPTAHL